MTDRKKPGKVVDLTRILDEKFVREKLGQQLREHTLEGVLGRLVATVEDLMFVLGQVDSAEKKKQLQQLGRLSDVANEAAELCFELTAISVRNGVLDWNTLIEVADEERRRRVQRWLDHQRSE